MVSHKYNWGYRVKSSEKHMSANFKMITKLLLDSIGVIERSTFFASDVNWSIREALKGTHPLKIEPPPSFLGYNRTLAKVKAPTEDILHISGNKNSKPAIPFFCMCERKTSLTKSTDENIIRIYPSSYSLVYHCMHILNCFQQTRFIFRRTLIQISNTKLKQI